MTRNLKTLTAVVIGLSVCVPAQAGGKSSHGYSTSSYHNYNTYHGYDTRHSDKHDSRYYTPSHYDHSSPYASAYHKDHVKPGPAGTYRDYKQYRTYSETYYASYTAKYATKFSDGFYYKGSEHRHWAYSYYSTTYRTTVYYDVATRGFYYYHAPQQSFFPMSYIEKAPPTKDLGPLPCECNE